MVRPSQAALRHCLEGECKEYQEIDYVSYCHYGVRMVEVEKGAKCRHKQYKKVIHYFMHRLPNAEVPTMTLQQEIEKYGRKQ
jgi:hypothetical protein